MTDQTPKNPGRFTGVGMLLASCVIGLGLMTLYFDDILGRQYNPNQRPVSQLLVDGGVEVALQRNRQGHYVLTGHINDVRAVFLLDTGATDVVIPEALAERAGLTEGLPTQAMTANGVVTVFSTSVPTLQLGDIALHDVRASINPAMQGDTVLLGMSALRHIEFTQRGDTLTLRLYRD